MLLRVEDWARDREPTEVTEEVGLCWCRGRWEWTEPSLVDLRTERRDQGSADPGSDQRRFRDDDFKVNVLLHRDVCHNL